MVTANETASAAVKPMNKTDLYEKIGERTGLKRKQVSDIFDILTEIMGQEMGKKGPGVFVLPGLLKLQRVHKPGIKGGKVVPNPWKRGETMVTRDKPAKNVIKARPLKRLKDMVH